MKILIVEDEPVFRRLLESFLLKWGYDVMVTCDGSEAWEVLHEPESPNMVVSDWMMPEMDGLELCRKIREMDRSGYIYFILLTAKARKKDVIQGLEAGADDFLIKPFDREELQYRIRIGERIINLERRILDLAATDPLTGVLNRRAFMERLEQEIERSRRGNTPISLIMADIDYFKRVNDRYGHQDGDIVLQRFVDQLTTSLRAYDFTARYGGEEFFVCLPGADGSQAGIVAERLRKRVEEMEVVFPDGSRSIRITASFGVASFLPEPQESIDSLIKRADEAMYRAKNEGKNRVCMAGEA